MNVSASMTAPEFRAAGTDLSERRRTGVSKGPVVDLVLPGDDGIIWAMTAPPPSARSRRLRPLPRTRR